jgi:translation elongation factor EF-4
MAESYSMEYIETSAKDGTNVEEIFETIIRMICEAVQVPVDEKTRCNEQVIVNLQASISYSNNKKRQCKC